MPKLPDDPNLYNLEALNAPSDPLRDLRAAVDASRHAPLRASAMESVAAFEDAREAALDPFNSLRAAAEASAAEFSSALAAARDPMTSTLRREAARVAAMMGDAREREPRTAAEAAAWALTDAREREPLSRGRPFGSLGGNLSTSLGDPFRDPDPLESAARRGRPWSPFGDSNPASVRRVIGLAPGDFREEREAPEERRLRYLRHTRIAAERRAIEEARAAEERLAALARPPAVSVAPEPTPTPSPPPSPPRSVSPKCAKARARANARGDTLRGMSSRAFLARLASHRKKGLSDARIADRYGMSADVLRAIEAAKRGAKRTPQGK